MKFLAIADTFGFLEFELAETGIEFVPFHTSSFEDVIITCTYISTRTYIEQALINDFDPRDSVNAGGRLTDPYLLVRDLGQV